MRLVWLDSAEKWQLGFQEPATPIMEGIIDLYNGLSYYLVIILILVGWILTMNLKIFVKNEISHKYYNHGSTLEILWTISPALVLISISLPSLKLLYFLDEVIDPTLTIKAIGNQWYWSYEYSDYCDKEEDTLSFDSYMVPTDDLQEGQLRLLEVDNRVVVPVDTHVRLVVTSNDVLHSWAVPSFGVKVDASPGRLNQTSMLIKREGVYYGQCSELCGVNHGFMPIVVEAVSLEDYINWVISKMEE